MEEQYCSPFSWLYCYPEEGVDELRHTLLCTTLELESTLIAAKDEIAKREMELVQLKEGLGRAIKERDEAHLKCHKLSMENVFLQQQLKDHHHQHQQQQQQQQVAVKEVQPSGVSISYSSDQDETKTESEKSTVVSPKSPVQNYDSLTVPQAALRFAACRPLPEQGKLLQAVQEAGPLLQNLLLAGPLPQWQHPPPQLSSIDIPPVTIPSPGLVHQEPFNTPSGLLCKKRSLEDSDTSINSKYQRTVL